MSQQITLCFFHELNEFLSQDKCNREFCVDYTEPRSVKDLIESIGIPHHEVDLIIISGDSDAARSVDFNYQVSAGDHISVYPNMASAEEGRR